MDIKTTEKVTEAKKWEDVLPAESISLGKQLLNKIGTSIAPKIQRASNERFISEDKPKDPYRLVISIGSEIDVDLDTDGLIREVSCTISGNHERVMIYEVSNYNYVLTKYLRNGTLVTQDLLMKDFRVLRYLEALRTANILN